jgi:hypothetical protein
VLDCIFNHNIMQIKDFRTDRRHTIASDIEARLLLEEQRCAAAAYRHALERVMLPHHPELLENLQNAHEDAADRLAACVLDPDSRALGRSVWSEMIQALDLEARVGARRSALWTLRSAEVLAGREYHACLARRSLPPGCEWVVRARLLPMARDHVRILDHAILALDEEVQLLP